MPIKGILHQLSVQSLNHVTSVIDKVDFKLHMYSNVYLCPKVVFVLLKRFFTCCTQHGYLFCCLLFFFLFLKRQK